MSAGSDSSLSISMGPPISEKAPFAGVFFQRGISQEQVMKLAMIAAGCTPGEAD
jgi:hypothetical protein